MEKNHVTIESIKRKASSDLTLRAIFFSLIVFGVALCLLFTLQLKDLHRVYLLGSAFTLVILINTLAWLLGRRSKHFQVQAALDWYHWDMNRIALFNEIKKQWKNNFESELSVALETLLAEAPSERERTKESAVRFVKDFLADTQRRKEILEMTLKNEDVELVKILEQKSTIEEEEEKMTDWLLDFINVLQQESNNEQLTKERLLATLKKKHIPNLEQKLGYYDALIASCEKSTQDLRMILKNHYKFKGKLE